MRKRILAAAAALLMAVLLIPAAAAAEPNPAEMAAMASFIASRTEGESYAVRLAMADVLLNQLADPRYPDTVSGVLARAGYRAGGDSPAYASARSAVRAAVEGMDVTGGATAWAYADTPEAAGLRVTLEIGGWAFGIR